MDSPDAVCVSTGRRFGGCASAMSKTLQYLTDARGEKTTVVLALSDYEKLLEDLEDLAVVAERRDEPTIPHAQFVGELKRNGLL